jgi:hypothetical protein
MTMAKLRRMTAMTDGEAAYKEIAALYEETFGERIRAGVEWVVPLFHSCTTGVVCDQSVERSDARKETIARTIDVLATIFHGREQADLLRQRTLGLREPARKRPKSAA